MSITELLLTDWEVDLWIGSGMSDAEINPQLLSVPFPPPPALRDKARE